MPGDPTWNEVVGALGVPSDAHGWRPHVTPPERPTACALCGRDPAVGYATADPVIRLCHGDEGAPMTCYHRWTVYGERPDRPTGEALSVEELARKIVAAADAWEADGTGSMGFAMTMSQECEIHGAAVARAYLAERSARLEAEQAARENDQDANRMVTELAIVRDRAEAAESRAAALTEQIDMVKRWFALFMQATGSWHYTCAICGAGPDDDHVDGCEFKAFLLSLAPPETPQEKEPRGQ